MTYVGSSEVEVAVALVVVVALEEELEKLEMKIL
jgi:hypothetical protein